jgi:4-diphosphocytidyl-2-C-methyl-D-erythritol kinase
MNQTLIFRSPAKINITLDILGQRDAVGYHPIQTIIQRIDLSDTITIEQTHSDQLQIISNIDLPYDNTIRRAYELACDVSGKSLGVNITIDKRIPIGSGLGGASSNAATVLLGLTKLFDIQMDREELVKLSKVIGMDVPFFVSEYSTALCTGYGEKLESIPPLSLSDILVVYPGFQISSADAYNSLDYSTVGKNKSVTHSIFGLLARGENAPDILLGNIHNDFLDSMILTYPLLQSVVTDFENYPEIAFGMSGSGSAFFVFAESDVLSKVQSAFEQKYNCFRCKAF